MTPASLTVSAVLASYHQKKKGMRLYLWRISYGSCLGLASIIHTHMSLQAF